MEATNAAVIYDLFGANPLGEIKHEPEKKGGRPQKAVGFAASGGVPLPVDLNFPNENMKVIEWDLIRWKIVVEGKIEAGYSINSVYQATGEGKAKPLKGSYSGQVGGAMQLQLNKP